MVESGYISKFTSKGLEADKYESYINLTLGGEGYTLSERDVKRIVSWMCRGTPYHYEVEGLIFNIKNGNLYIDDFDGGYAVVNLSEFTEWISYE